MRPPAPTLSCGRKRGQEGDPGREWRGDKGKTVPTKNLLLQRATRAGRLDLCKREKPVSGVARTQDVSRERHGCRLGMGIQETRSQGGSCDHTWRGKAHL